MPAYDNKKFYKTVFALVLPITIQFAINTAVTAADVVMLGGVGETVLSGASLANQIQFLMTMLLAGTASGAVILTAQYWGSGEKEIVAKIFGLSFRVSIFAAILFFVSAFFFPEMLMRIYTSDPAVIAEGAKYLHIVAFGYLFSAFTMMYLHIVRTMNRVIVSTVIYAVSLVVNVIVNYTLINGAFGFPRLEVRGAAIGTVIARMVEFALMLIYVKKINKDIELHIKDIFHNYKWLWKDFVKYTLPVLASELMTGVGATVVSSIIGHLGSAAVAANSIAQVERQFALAIGTGIAAASCIVIGQMIGENKLELARICTHKLVRLTLFFGAIGSAIILATSPAVREFMNITPQAKEYLLYMQIVMALCVLAQSYNYCLILGALRAGGDVAFGTILTAVTLYGGAVLFGFLAAFVWKWSVPVVYCILLCDDFLRVPFAAWRLHSGKWLKRIVRE